jgi:hypothetical protein
MFENFCALLLRLYPAEFRHRYGSEAVQLMRDHARHERGVFPRLRLLNDLALELGAISLHGIALFVVNNLRPRTRRPQTVIEPPAIERFVHSRDRAG